MVAETKWTPKGVEWRMSGVVRLDEIEALNAEFTRDPRSDEARYQLLDLRAVERIDIPPASAQALGAYDAAQSLSTPNVRVAVLTTDDRFDALIAAYAQMLEDTTWTARGFTDEARARAWIAGASG